jgi:preprotein translocase subunit SecD
MMNTGLIEIMAPADPVQDPSVKSAYEFVAQMNSNLKEINKRRTIADYVWEKRNDFTLPADYEIATIIDYSSIHSQPVKEPVEILLLKKKALFNNSDFESIEYFEEKDPEIPERYGLAIKLKKEAARKFEEYTRKNKGSKIFTFIDHEFIAGPIIHEPITSGAFVISRWTRVKEFFKMMARYRKAEFYQCQVVSDR